MNAAPVPDFLASENGERSAGASLFHVLPVPYEGSVSYGLGTRHGPAAILEASQQLEAWDGLSTPLELGIHTAPALDCSGTLQQVLERIRAESATVMRSRKLPVLLGGEHTVTLGALQAATEIFSGPIGLFQLDAHADLRDCYEGSRYSHACVARRAHEDLGVVLCQFGVRALCHEEERYRRQHTIAAFDGVHIYRQGVDAFSPPADFPKLVYLSLDVDGLDPSVIRATGTPVPGGPGWYDTLEAIATVITGRTVIGFDVVELAPRSDDHASCFAAAQLVYSVMGLIQRNWQTVPPETAVNRG